MVPAVRKGDIGEHKIRGTSYKLHSLTAGSIRVDRVAAKGADAEVSFHLRGSIIIAEQPGLQGRDASLHQRSARVPIDTAKSKKEAARPRSGVLHTCRSSFEGRAARQVAEFNALAASSVKHTYRVEEHVNRDAQ